MPSFNGTIPNSQRQWQQAQPGMPKNALRLVDDVSIPSPSSGEVLVKIAYATITPSSWKIMRDLPGFIRNGAVPELEASGWVVDKSDSELENGTEVTGVLTLSDHLWKARGCLTEYTLFKAEHLFRIPSNLTLSSATGLLSSGMTAYKALAVTGKVRSGTRLFINGGTTACGMAAIQIARILGAEHIAVSCSQVSFSLVKELGADEAMDYRSAPLATQLSACFSAAPFDVVMDCVGSHTLFVASPSFLKPSGTFVTIAPDITPEAGWTGIPYKLAQLAGDVLWPTLLGGTPRKFALSQTPVARHLLLNTVKWAEEGRLKVPIDSVHASDLEGVLAAYDRSISGRPKGKILIEMSSSSL